MPAEKPSSLVSALGTITKKGQRLLGGFMFEMFIEEYYPLLLKEMKRSLSTLSPDDIKEMVKNRRYPGLPLHVYQALQGYEDYLKGITVERLWRAFVEACPELATAVDEMGDDGYRWFARLRNRTLKSICHGAVANAPGETSVPVVGLTCDHCHQTMLVRQDMVETITECSFCKMPAKDEEAPPPKPEAPPVSDS